MRSFIFPVCGLWKGRALAEKDLGGLVCQKQVGRLGWFKFRVKSVAWKLGMKEDTVVPEFKDAEGLWLARGSQKAGREWRMEQERFCLA